MAERIIIVPYNPDWPAWFTQMTAFVEPALAGVAYTIEHVGSTSIPGMAAKPIIDANIVVDRLVFPRVKGGLATMGYVHQGNLGIPDREAFDLRDPQARQALPPHHLYVCMSGATELRNQLLFRDYLRTHDVDARAYAALKYRLAEQFGADRAGYSDGKSPFIADIMRQADQWARQAGWTLGASGA